MALSVFVPGSAEEAVAMWFTVWMRCARALGSGKAGRTSPSATRLKKTTTAHPVFVIFIEVQPIDTCRQKAAQTFLLPDAILESLAAQATRLMI